MSALALAARCSGARPCKPASELPDHLLCNSCSEVLFNSYQTPHGCRLCQRCYDEKLAASERRLCPGNTEACRDEEEEEIMISQSTCFPDIATRRDIAKLMVMCPNEAAGCQVTVQWRELEPHLDVCEFEYGTCSQCQQQFLKQHMEKHMKYECEQRREECKLCKQPVVHSQLSSEHLNLESAACCAKFSKLCPHCNDTSVGELDRRAYLQHLPACRERPAECKFAHLGCTHRAKASDLKQHYEKRADLHIELLDAKFRDTAAAQPTVSPVAASQPGDVGDDVGGAPSQLKSLQQRFGQMHEMFKKLQINVANWAHTALEFQQLAEKYGGVPQFSSYLKTLDDRQNNGGGGGGGGTSSTSQSAAPASAAASADVQALHSRFGEIEIRLQNLERTNYSGQLVWKVANFAARRREAKEKRVGSVFSQPFFSRHYGHQFRARLFLDGCGSGDGQQLGVGLVVIQSDYDDALDWPLTADVTFKLLSHRGRREEDVKKTVSLSTGSARPADREDLTVGCVEEKFAPLSLLDSADSRFVKDDSFFLAVDVECRGGGGGGADSGRRGGRRK